LLAVRTNHHVLHLGVVSIKAIHIPLIVSFCISLWGQGLCDRMVSDDAYSCLAVNHTNMGMSRTALEHSMKQRVLSWCTVMVHSPIRWKNLEKIHINSLPTNGDDCHHGVSDKLILWAFISYTLW